MSLQRSVRAFITAAAQTRQLSPRTQAQKERPFSQTFHPLATQGYGDGQGDPKGEKPQEQGSSTSAQHDAEHPGPAPPATDDSAGIATKTASDSSSGTKDPSEASASSGGSRSKEGKEPGSSPTGEQVGGSESTSHQTRSPKPKILDRSTPSAESPEKQAEVEQHNREFEKGYDRAPKAEEDKVDKKFWSS